MISIPRPLPVELIIMFDSVMQINLNDLLKHCLIVAVYQLCTCFAVFQKHKQNEVKQKSNQI